MAIYAPGRRDRHNRPGRGGRRNIVAMLSLTAMVDMFTVLAVFLLQNYNTTGEVIDVDDEVVLPIATAVKELRPSNVIVVSKDKLTLNKDQVATYAEIQAQQDWKIEGLFAKLSQSFQEAQAKLPGLGQLREAVDQTKPEGMRENPEDFRRVTLQADKSVDFLTIKKIMYTITEAGASEINFAVMKDEAAE